MVSPAAPRRKKTAFNVVIRRATFLGFLCKFLYLASALSLAIGGMHKPSTETGDLPGFPLQILVIFRCSPVILNDMAAENPFAEEEPFRDGTGEVIGCQGGEVSHAPMQIDGLGHSKELGGNEEYAQGNSTDHVNSLQIDGLGHSKVLGGNEEYAQGNSNNHVNSLGDKNNDSDGVSSLLAEEENDFNIPELPIEEFEGLLELDKELFGEEVSKAIHSSPDVDMTGQSSKASENDTTKSYLVDEPVSEGITSGVQGKETSLEGMVSASGAKDSSLCLTAHEEVEDGEISGDTGVHKQMDVVLLKDKGEDKVQIPEKDNEKQDFANTVPQRGVESYTNTSPLFLDTANNVGSCAEVERGGINRNLVEYNSEIFYHGKAIGLKVADGHDCRPEFGKNKKPVGEAKESACHAVHPEILAPSGKSSGEIATKNQGVAANSEDANACQKKRKRSTTKERREKKKKKERIKRAETNRKLGVKRLKLQPVLKPKTVKLCRHYINGRCHEGEKCKYSHDTIPLTKSKLFSVPCSMAGGSVMMSIRVMGGEAWVDEWTDFLVCGFLSFPQMPVKDASLCNSTVPESELKSVTLLGNSSSKKQVNLEGTSSHQNADGKSYSTGIFPGKRMEQNVMELIPKPAAQSLGRSSFLPCAKSSVGQTSDHRQAGISLKPDDGAKFGHQVMNGALAVIRNSNGTSKRTPAVAPPGISLLSSGKPPSGDDNGKKSSALPPGKDYGIGKSPLGESNKVEQAGSSQKQDAREMAASTPALAPRGINFLSFARPPSADSGKTKQACLRPNVDNAVPLFSQERERLATRIQFPNEASWRSPSSSSSRGQSLDTCTPSSSQKLLMSTTPSSVSSALSSSGVAILNATPWGLPSSSCPRGPPLDKCTPSSSQKSLLSSTSRPMQKALQSTMAFAAKFNSGVKMDWPSGAAAVSTGSGKEAGTSDKKSAEASTILDILASMNGQ
ncbi:hypothetical protein RJ639_008381 [Escallonia herrerae]|uniref:C3H1-type domain-containing protein n=1 Tax=Escallonia herrerae TaxID=1293975 RepID=A0AA88VSR9_9ASTE|nr:hypothetical protein RJ639_008381 [Escallonia herrerae]